MKLIAICALLMDLIMAVFTGVVNGIAVYFPEKTSAESEVKIESGQEVKTESNQVEAPVEPHDLSEGARKRPGY